MTPNVMFYLVLSGVLTLGMFFWIGLSLVTFRRAREAIVKIGKNKPNSTHIYTGDDVFNCVCGAIASFIMICVFFVAAYTAWYRFNILF